MKTIKKLGLFLLVVISSLPLIKTKHFLASNNEPEVTHGENLLNNPDIIYTGNDTTITNWKLSATDNISGYKQEARSMLKNTSGGQRQLDGFSYVKFNQDNQVPAKFSSYLTKTNKSGFFVIAQTVSGLKLNETYTFRVTLEGDAKISLYAHNGTNIAGGGVVEVINDFTLSTGMNVVEFSFRPQNSTTTVSIRHIFNSSKDTNFTIESIELMEEIAPDLLNMREQVKQDAINNIISQYNLDYDFYLEEITSSILSTIENEILKINFNNYENTTIVAETSKLQAIINNAIESDVPNALNTKLNGLLSDERITDVIFNDVKAAIQSDINNKSTNEDKAAIVNLIEANINNQELDFTYSYTLATEPTWIKEGLVLGITSLYSQHTLNLNIPKLNDAYYDRVDIDELKGEFTIINNEYDLDKTVFIKYRVPVYYVSHASNASDNNPGTFEAPFYRVTKAIEQMTKGIVVITSDMLFEGTVTIQSGKDIMITSSNKDIEKDIPTEFYTINRASNSQNPTININGNGKVTLENITIKGLETTNRDNGLIKIENGQLIINDGTTITGGRRSGGGGAIQVNNNAVITMNGGLITGNFFTIGVFGTSSTTTLNFLGGEMSGNTSDSFQVMNFSNAKVTFGGNFILKDNFKGSQEINAKIYNNTNILIREDFTGEVYLNTDPIDSKYGTHFTNFKYVDINGNVITDADEHYHNIRPVDNKYLYLKYTNDGKYIWDYQYEEERTIVIAPTTTSTGVYAKRDIIGDEEYSSTIYIDEIILPKLSLENYYFEYDEYSQEITYTSKKEGLEVLVNVNLDDNNFVSEITTEPTLEDIGTIKTTNQLYPGLVFEDTLPTIDSNLYTITTSNEFELTYQIKLDNPHQSSIFVLDVDLSDFSDFELVTNPKINNVGLITGTSELYPNAILEITLPNLSDSSFYESKIDIFYNTYTSNENLYELDLEFIHYTADIYYVDVINGNDNNPGTFLSPSKNLTPIINKIKTNKPAIVVYKNNFVNVLVNYDINNKTIKIMTSDVDITQGKPSKTYNVTIDSGNTGSLYTLSSGAYLELENIYINGNRTSTTSSSGSIISVGENSTVVINEGTTIKGGHRSSGGGAFFMYANSKLYMYGGLITENYSLERSAAIGIYSEASNVKLYFLGGEISNNEGRAMTSTSSAIYYFGGDFKLYGNRNSTMSSDSNLALSYSNKNVFIREGFSGRIDFNDSTSPLHGKKVSAIQYVNEANEPISGTGVEFLDIRVENNQFVYLRHDDEKGYFVWDYHYQDEMSLVLEPTMESEGIIARKAITADGFSDTIYLDIDKVILPKLSDTNFYDKDSLQFKDVYRPKESLYDLDLEFSYYTADIFYIDIINGDDTNLGTFENPLKNISAAINKTSTNKPAIFVLMNDYIGVKGAYEITGKIIRIMSSDVDINKGKTTEIYRISTLSNIKESLFKLTNATLELENIILDGSRTLTTAEEDAGSLIYLYDNSTVIINNGTTLTGGHRPLGGSVMFLSGTNIKIVMNGGLITENYSTVNSSTIGTATNSSGNIYFLGGKVINNTTESGRTIFNNSGVNYYFGGDFELHSNQNQSQGFSVNFPLSYSFNNIFIIKGFNGLIDFNDTTSPLHGKNVSPIRYVNEDYQVIAGTGVEFENIRVSQNQYVYLRHDDLKGYFVWDYYYEEDLTLLLEPTTTTTGVLARRAIVGNDEDGYMYSNTIYIDGVELPILTLSKYEFVDYDELTNEITYTYYDEVRDETIELKIIVDLNDLNFDVEVITNPTANVVGEIIATNSNYPGLEVVKELPQLSNELYELTYEDNKLNFDATLSAPFNEVHFEVEMNSEDLTDFKLVNKPTKQDPGIMTAQHQDFSGVVVEIVLPNLLDDTFYEMTFSDEFEERYKIIDNNYNTDLEVIHYLVARIIYVDGDESGGNDSNPGNYESPMRHVSTAFTTATIGEPTIVVLKKDYNTSTGYDVKGGRIIKLISSTVDIEKENPNEQFAITRNSGVANGTLTVDAQSKLVLEGVIIDGGLNKNSTKSSYGVIDVNGTLIIRDNTVIRNGNRDPGGSGLFVSSTAIIYMYGGEITNNYAGTGSSAIGVKNGHTVSNLYLLGGKIVGNSGDGRPISNSFENIYIGGDFSLYNNLKNNGIRDVGITTGTNNIYIYEGFTGKVMFEDVRGYNEPIPNIQYIDAAGNPLNVLEQIDFLDINNSRDVYLHLVLNGTTFTWGYQYSGLEVLTPPTISEEGILAYQAIIGDGVLSDVIYIEMGVLPKLSIDDYDISILKNKVLYEIEVDGVSFIFERSNEDFLEVYKDELDNLVEEPSKKVQAIIDNAKTLLDNATSVDEINEIINNTELAVELALAKEVAVQDINDYISTLDKDDYSEANWQEVLNAKSAAVNQINVLDDISAVESTRDAGIALINAVEKDLAHAKAEAIIDLNALLTEQDSNTVKAIVDAAISAIATASSIEEVSTIVSQAELDIETQRELELKIEEAKQEINDYILSLDKDYYTEDDWNLVLSKQTQALQAIEEAEDIEAVLLAKSDGLALISEVKTALDTEFDIEVTIKPTNTKVGSAVATHQDYPNLEFLLELPTLEDEGYLRTLEGLTFTYEIDLEVPFIDGTVTFDVEVDFNDLKNFELNTEPTIDSPGLVTAINEDYPGVIFEFELPILTDSDFYEQTFFDLFEEHYVSNDNIYGLDLEIKYYKADIIYVALATNGGNDSNPGTFDAPLLTIAKAISTASVNQPRIIVIKDDFTISATMNITSKTIKIMSSEVDITVDEPIEKYTIFLASNKNVSIFKVSEHSYLQLEHIIIDGQRTISTSLDNGLISVYDSVVVVNDETVIKGARRSNGGGGILVYSNSTLTINGGLFTGNYGQDGPFGFIVDSKNMTLNLLGGTIINNTPVTRVFNMHPSLTVTIGKDFVLRENFDSSDIEVNTVYGESTIKYIREDFSGVIYFNDTREDLYRQEVENFTYIDMDGNIIDGDKIYFNIHPIQDKYLYLKYDVASGKYIWDYHYDNEITEISREDIEGDLILAKKAIIGGNADDGYIYSNEYYIEEEIYPALNLDNYEFLGYNEETNTVIYQVKEDGQILELSIDLESEINQINIIDIPSLNKEGLAEVTFPFYPGIEYEIILPTLNDERYTSMSQDFELTYQIDLGGYFSDVTFDVVAEVDDLYEYELITNPKITEPGLITAKSDLYPNQIFEFVLPKLTDEEFYDTIFEDDFE